MAEFTPRVVKRTAIGFHPTVLPAVYDDALSYYEELNKILHSLNDAIEVIDENRALILQLDANVKELDARLTAQIKQVADDLATLRKEYEVFRDEVKAKIAAIEAKDREQDNRLNSIETKNNQQDARLTAIETKNTQQDGEINALKSRCATLESDLGKLTTRVTTLENNLSALTTSVSTAETYITELQGDIERIDHEQTVQNNRIEELNKILHSLNDAIEGIDENRALILQLDANVKELDARLTAQIKQVADDLATLRKEYEVFRDEVKAKIAAIEAKDREQDNRLNSIETKNTQQDGEINALKSRYATLESDLGKLTTRVTTLENNLSALTTSVSTAETYITELQGDIERIDHEQTVQNNRIKDLEDRPSGGAGSAYGQVDAYQLWANDGSTGQLHGCHFIRHVDLQSNKHNILLNTGGGTSVKEAIEILFAHHAFVEVGEPEIDELIITSWSPEVCSAAAIQELKTVYTIKHAWIPSSINWTNYTGADKDAVKAVEAGVIAALHEGTNTDFTRMGDDGADIDVGAITFNCLYDPTIYGKTNANLLCRIKCSCDMLIPGNGDLGNAILHNEAIARWMPNILVISGPVYAYPDATVKAQNQRYNPRFTFVEYNMTQEAPVTRSVAYGGLQWVNISGEIPDLGAASMISLSGDMPRLTPTTLTKFLPSLV